MKAHKQPIRISQIVLESSCYHCLVFSSLMFFVVLSCGVISLCHYLTSDEVLVAEQNYFHIRKSISNYYFYFVML